MMKLHSHAQIKGSSIDSCTLNYGLTVFNSSKMEFYLLWEQFI